MKILILSKGIPTKKNPQFGCFAMDQASALQAAGHQVAIMFVNGFIGKIWKKPGFYKYSQNGIICYEVFGLPIAILKKFINVNLGILLEAWWSRHTFRRVVEDFGFPDIVHAHFLESMVQGASIKRKYPIKLVGTEHWSKISVENIDKSILRYGSYAYPMVDSLISVSQNLRNYIFKYFGKNSVVIHNLIQTKWLKPALVKTENEKYTILGVGSLIPRKGFDVLIKAITNSRLPKQNVLVKIYGDGVSRESLQQLIDENKLNETVILCGRQPKEIIYEALNKADLFVLSSHHENFSVALIEATGNGVPAIATLCGGVEEYPVSNVIKIPVDNVNDMANALEHAYANRENNDRIEIQKETLNNFAPEEIIKRIEKVYKNLKDTEKEKS